MSRRSKKKNEVNDYEYTDGYALVHDEMIDAIIDGYREGWIRKDQLRAIAGDLELAKQHGNSKVDIYHIINRKADKKRRIKKLTHSEIASAREDVSAILDGKWSGKRSAISRRFLRYIARGLAACSQALLLLYYCKRRIKQARCIIWLFEKERYARFTYGDLAEASGMRRASLCDGLKLLLHHGLLAVVQVAKQNENRYGQVFVDGHTVSLTRLYGDEKTVTNSDEKRNSPRRNTVTLINGNPNTVKLTSSIRIEEQERLERAAADENHPAHLAAVRALVRQSLDSAIAVAG